MHKNEAEWLEEYELVRQTFGNVVKRYFSDDDMVDLLPSPHYPTMTHVSKAIVGEAVVEATELLLTENALDMIPLLMVNALELVFETAYTLGLMQYKFLECNCMSVPSDPSWLINLDKEDPDEPRESL